MTVKSKTSCRPFTLIELLVVIAIIAILASMLLPALSQVRAHGKNSQCNSQKKSLGTYFDLYAADYNDYFVPAYQWIEKDDKYWNETIDYVYTKDNTIFRKLNTCPADLKTWSWTGKAYGICAYISGGLISSKPWHGIKKVSKVKYPGTMFIIADKSRDNSYELDYPVFLEKKRHGRNMISVRTVSGAVLNYKFIPEPPYTLRKRMGIMAW